MGPIARVIAQGLTYAEDMRNKTWCIFKVETTQHNTICVAKRSDEGKEWMIGYASSEEIEIVGGGYTQQRATDL
jgi:hypothetical protein